MHRLVAAQGVHMLSTDWLEKCEREHVDTCSPSPLRSPSYCGFTIKLIDIQHCCVVDAEDGARYVALSYVWGGAQQLRLLKDNKELLMSAGGIRVAYTQVPATIQDCIRLCEEVGERYLWVDTLCIIQDDPLDKKWQISRMGMIYAGAALTVAAAHGHDANAGLPRWHLVPSADRSELRKKPLARAKGSSPDVNEAFSSSTWDSRGWTFQEKVLSHRLLVFSNDQIYLKCRFGTVSKDAHGFDSMSGKSSDANIRFDRETSNPPLSSLTADLERYTTSVADYSSRCFTCQGDALDAFAGILGQFAEWEKMNNTFTFALPTVAFDYAFCWSVEEHVPKSRRLQFPSWSWIGWAQKSSYERAGEYRFTSNIIKSTFQAINNTWASFQSKVLGPRCWGDFSHSSHLMIETSTAMLRVSRIRSAFGKKGESSYLYTVSCPYDDSVIYGLINLDSNWRETKADEMQFIIIHVTRSGDHDVITHTLCIEEVGRKHYRVNMMQSTIATHAWEAAKPCNASICLF